MAQGTSAHAKTKTQKDQVTPIQSHTADEGGVGTCSLDQVTLKDKSVCKKGPVCYACLPWLGC